MTPSLLSLSTELSRSLVFHDPVKSNLDGFFRDLGLVHLFTASGIHLLALFFWLDLLIKAAGRRLAIPIRWVKPFHYFVFLIISLLVWSVEGFHPSLFRPLLSVLIRVGLKEFGFRAPVLFPLALVFSFEWALSFKPGLPPGATHYYLSVAGSLIALSRENSSGRGIRLHLRMAVYSWVPIALLDLFLDHWVVVSTPLLSLISIPIVSFFLYPLSLLSIALTHTVPLGVIQLWSVFLKGLVLVLEVLPGGFSVDPRYFSLGIFLGSVGMILRSQVRPLLLPYLILILSLPVLLQGSGATQWIQLDVGQGDAAVLKKPGRIELIDIGSGRVQTPDHLLRQLARYGITRVDGVLLSHLDEDHSGGLATLLALISVGCVEMGAHHQREVRGEHMVSWIKSHDPGIKVQGQGCIQNGRVAWFESARGGAKGNEWMAGISSSWKKQVYLALGDGDEEQEQSFLREFQMEIDSHPIRIWKVGHHGSRFSSNPEVLRTIHPNEFWISVGKRNHYHHPSPETLARLARFPGKVRRTDQEGDLVMDSME